MKVTCPCCNKEIEIPDSQIASYLGRKGGRKSKRELSKEEAQRVVGFRTNRNNKIDNSNPIESIVKPII